MARRVSLLASTLLVAACAGGNDGEPVGTLGFTVNDNGASSIWTMAADGSERTALTESPRTDAAGATNPAWSPDGARIAFAAQLRRTEDPNRTELYIMDADGRNVRRLTRNAALDASPTWSPDGRRIAFMRTAGFGTERPSGGIFAMAADGSGTVQISRAPRHGFDVAPEWSPDGGRIAFTRVTYRKGSEEPAAAVFTVAPNGSRVRRLLDQAAELSWSPDGEKVAYSSVRDSFGETCFHECATSAEIYVANADGSDERRLTESEANDTSPAWSPDGRWVAFVSDRSDPSRHENEIYVMDAEDGDVRRITENDVWDLEPAWRPR